jgi:hypothetical protein
MLNRSFKTFRHRGDLIEFNWHPLFAEQRYHGGSAPSAPNPAIAAQVGIWQTEKNFPFATQINELAQTGGKQTINGKTYDFTNLGTADIQNKYSDQMAATLLAIQQQYGAAYIQQRLADLKQSDPSGYAAYQQLFDKIQQEAAQTPPDMPLSKATQDSINGILKGSTSLTPDEMSQVKQQQGSQDAASGIMLGNAPAQALGTGAVQAVDNKTNQAEAAANAYLSKGISPSDIAYRALQQNMANEANFANGTNPTAQFSSLAGAQSGAAPTPNSGFQQQQANEFAAAAQGIGNANQLFGYQNQIAQNSANPYLAGLSTALQGVGTITNAMQQPSTTPYGIPQTGNFYSGYTTPYGSIAGLSSSAPTGTFTTDTTSYAPDTMASTGGAGY